MEPTTSQHHEVHNLKENLPPRSDLPGDLVTEQISDHEIDHNQVPKQPCLDPVFKDQIDPDHQSSQKLEQELIASLKKKLKLSQQRNRHLAKKVTSLQDIVKQLSQHNLISSNCEEMLSQTFSGVPLAMLKKMSTKKSGKALQYSPEIKSFALTLQFYSAKAYEFVRQTLILPFPVNPRSQDGTTKLLQTLDSHNQHLMH